MGCFLCGLSVAEALVLGTMMGGEEASGPGLPGRRAQWVCPTHTQMIQSVDAHKLARIATQVTGRAFVVDDGRRRLGR